MPSGPKQNGVAGFDGSTWISGVPGRITDLDLFSLKNLLDGPPRSIRAAIPLGTPLCRITIEGGWVGCDNGQEGKEHHCESCFGEGDSGRAYENGQASPVERPVELAEEYSCEHDQDNNIPWLQGEAHIKCRPGSPTPQACQARQTPGGIDRLPLPYERLIEMRMDGLSQLDSFLVKSQFCGIKETADSNQVIQASRRFSAFRARKKGCSAVSL